MISFFLFISPIALRAVETYGYVTGIVPGVGLSLREADVPIILKYQENIDFEAAGTITYLFLGPVSYKASSSLLIHPKSYDGNYWYVGTGIGINRFIVGNSAHWDGVHCPYIPVVVGRQQNGFIDLGCDISFLDSKVYPFPTIRWAWKF